MVVESEVVEETGGSFVDFKVVSTSDVGEMDSVIPAVESVVVLYTDVSVGINVDSNAEEEDVASVKSVVNPSVDKSEGKVSVSVLLDDGSEVEIEEVFSVEVLKDVVSVTVLDEGSVEE
jgi:hypothetical protein